MRSARPHGVVPPHGSPRPRRAESDRTVPPHERTSLLTWPAALPAAAVRVMRSAAGRRALQVVVLVGGLFALGFLCGEQAHAADGAPGTSAPGPMGPVAPTVPAASANGVEAWLKDAVGRLVAAPA